MVQAQSETFIVFKLLGSMLILISSFLWGYMSSLKPYKRYKNLLKISQGLMAMENEIRYSSDYIDVVLKRVANTIGFDKLFLSCASYDNSLPISKRWKQSVLNDYKSLELTDADCEILFMLGAELGMTDREGQLKNIENSVGLLKVLQESAKEEYEKMSRLKKGIGITLGLFAVIILT